MVTSNSSTTNQKLYLNTDVRVVNKQLYDRRGLVASNSSLSGMLKYTAQTLTAAQQQQARTNIGAGTSNFSGDYNDLTNKPDVADTGVKVFTVSCSSLTWSSSSNASGYAVDGQYQAIYTDEGINTYKYVIGAVYDDGMDPFSQYGLKDISVRLYGVSQFMILSNIMYTTGTIKILAVK